MQRANDLSAREAGQASGIEIDRTGVFGRGRLPSVGVPEPAGVLLDQLKASGACAAGQRAEQHTDRADEQCSPPTVLRHVASPPLGVSLHCIPLRRA